MHLLTLDEVKAKYATNARRLELFDVLTCLVDKSKTYFDSFTVVLYGSFITEKPHPNDIDIVVSGVLNRANFARYLDVKKDLKDSTEIHLLSDITSSLEIAISKNGDELVTWFNTQECNSSKGISILDFVEISYH